MSKHLPRHPARVFVAGHQRPDADTAVSAFVAARLKSALDPDRDYQPILPGEANQQTRWIFERAGELLPAVHPDIRHTVAEGMSLDFIRIREEAHLSEAVDLMHQSSGSLIPVSDENSARAEVLLGGAAQGEGRLFAGMVSRKKQLLPMIFQNLDLFSKRRTAR